MFTSTVFQLRGGGGLVTQLCLILSNPMDTHTHTHTHTHIEKEIGNLMLQ